MADKTIGQLPELGEISDSSLLPVEDSGTAYHTTGAAWKTWVQNAIASLVAIVQSAAGRADDDATRAETAAASASADAAAIQGMTISSEVLEAGSTPTLAKQESGGVWNLHFGLAPGERGPQGIQGPAGPQGVQGPRGDTGTAVAVETSGMYFFNVDNDSSSPTFGHLFLTYSGDDAPDFSIVDGHLIWTVD